MRRGTIPGVVFQPHTQQGFQRGINQIVDAIRPTLGPQPRCVAVENVSRSKAPEFLDDGALIARRIVQLSDRDADPGAMLLRHTLWRIHEEVGDGTATAALIFHTVYTQGLRYTIAGGNAIYLRRALEEALTDILHNLDAMTLSLSGQATIAQLAESICYDAPLAKMLGEIFDIVGEYGEIDVGISHGRDIERSYVEGMFWKSGILSPHMLVDTLKQRSDLLNAALVMSDLELNDSHDVIPLLEMAIEQQLGNLIIIAQSISDNVLATLLSASQDPGRLRVIAVRTPGSGTVEQAAALEDLALLAGGRPLRSAAGDTLRRCTHADLGRVRRAWADRRSFGIIGGKGDARALRQHIAMLRASFRSSTDNQQRSRLQERIGKLMGGSASLAVGGNSETEILMRETLARRTVALLRRAMREGVLPGGGIALLACRERLEQRLMRAATTDEQAACRILIKALEQPLRTLATNAGYDSEAVMAELEHAAPGYGFDLRTGLISDMAQAGVYDIAGVVKTALRIAVAGAATALTVDVLVQKRNPESRAGTP